MANGRHRQKKSLASRIAPCAFTALLMGGVGYHAIEFETSPTSVEAAAPKVVEPELPLIPAALDAQYGDDTVSLCAAFLRAEIDCEAIFVLDQKVPVGGLVSQTPGAGLRGESVELVYSKGAAQVVVPILSGLSKQDALERLWASGLVLGKVTTVDAPAEKGTVVTASLAPSANTRNGTAIDLSYSNGKVSVPNWVGKPKELVEAEASQFGVRVEFKEEESDSPAGVVLRQDSPGKRIPFRTVVTVVVSKASDTEVEVPDVVGMTQEQAIALLASEGFLKITTIGQGEAEGAVVESMLPAAGETAVVGDEITITVAAPQ